MTSSWAETYDLFVSYARTDDRESGGMVSSLVAEIESAFGRFSPENPLQVFFDRDKLVDLQDWQQRIESALGQSKVMLAVVSPAYFQSEWCRREFEGYLRHEHRRTYPGESIQPVFITGEQDLESIIPDEHRPWWEELKKRNGLMAQSWWDGGIEKLKLDEVRERLDRISAAMADRCEMGRRLAAVPRNLPQRNPRFTGRDQQLADLRDRLSRFEQVGLCAVGGMGGVGKTSLAYEYAWRFRPEYLGGQFAINLSRFGELSGDTESARDNQRDLLKEEFVSLARDHLGAAIPLDTPIEQAYVMAQTAITSNPPDGNRLIILDNLNESATWMVGRGERAWWPIGERVHYVITTRAGQNDLGDLESLSLDVLSPTDAMDLFFAYRPYERSTESEEYQAALVVPGAALPTDSETEWKSALAIVQRVGRLTLAVELIAAYLRVNPSIPIADFLADMETAGIGVALETVADHDPTRQWIEHPEPLIGAILDQTVGQLNELEKIILQLAAYLPANQIVVGWIHETISSDPRRKGLLDRLPLQSDPWLAALQRLHDRRLLTEQDGVSLRHLHRLIGERLRSHPIDESVDSQTLLQVAGDDIESNGSSKLSQDLIDRIDAYRTIVSQPSFVLYDSNCWSVFALADLHQRLGNVSAVTNLLQTQENSSPILEERNWSALLDKVGDVLSCQGNLSGALSRFERSLSIRESLLSRDAGDTQTLRDVSVSLSKVGNVLLRQGDLNGALTRYERSLSISESLLSQDAHDTQTQRDVSVSLEKVGDVLSRQGELSGALTRYERSLSISESLLSQDAGDTQTQRDVSVSLDRLGDVLSSQGDLKGALSRYERSLSIRESLLSQDAGDTQTQRDVSLSLDIVGDVFLVQGDLSGALSRYERSLSIRESLLSQDAGDINAQFGLCFSYFRLAKTATRADDPEGRMKYRRLMRDKLRELRDADVHFESQYTRVLEELENDPEL